MKTFGKIIAVAFFGIGAIAFIGVDNVMAVICAVIAIFVAVI